MFKKLMKEALGKSRKVLYIFNILINNLFKERTHTYCYWLWDQAFINEYGYVASCCHFATGAIGNIYKQDLYKIWEKSVRLKLFQWLSLHGCLECFWKCSLLSLKEKENSTHYRGAIKYPKFLHIVYSTFCNFNCVMCGQDHKSGVALDSDVLKKNIDWDQVEEIILQGGEILAIKSAKEFYLWLTQQKNKKVNLITNGILIDDEWADYLIKGSKWIDISVNAATEDTFKLVNNNSGFNKVIDNIKKLVYLKHKYGADVKIRYHFTIIPQNIMEIPDAILLADKLGCDVVTYSYDVSSVPVFFNKNRDIREQIKNKVVDLINNGGLKIKIRGQFLEHLGLLNNSVNHDVISYSI